MEKMNKKAFIKNLILSVVTLVIGGIAMGFSYLGEWLSVIGFVILTSAMIFLMCILGIWYYKLEKLSDTFIFSVSGILIGLILTIIGICVKLKFVAIIGGFFSTFNLIALIICMYNILCNYFEEIDEDENIKRNL